LSLRVTIRIPTAFEYETLCRSVGWTEEERFACMETALACSLFGVIAEAGGELAGMGRVVGDGAMYFYVHDVVVSPRHQGAGVGKAMMDAIVARLLEIAPPGAKAFLFAADGKAEFYRRLGFEPSARGMSRLIADFRP
jgi:GNAT superfamily N-acetyltransferase